MGSKVSPPHHDLGQLFLKAAFLYDNDLQTTKQSKDHWASSGWKALVAIGGEAELGGKRNKKKETKREACAELSATIPRTRVCFLKGAHLHIPQTNDLADLVSCKTKIK